MLPYEFQLVIFLYQFLCFYCLSLSSFQCVINSFVIVICIGQCKTHECLVNTVPLLCGNDTSQHPKIDRNPFDLHTAKNEIPNIVHVLANARVAWQTVITIALHYRALLFS